MHLAAPPSQDLVWVCLHYKHNNHSNLHLIDVLSGVNLKSDLTSCEFVCISVFDSLLLIRYKHLGAETTVGE